MTEWTSAMCGKLEHLEVQIPPANAYTANNSPPLYIFYTSSCIALELRRGDGHANSLHASA